MTDPQLDAKQYIQKVANDYDFKNLNKRQRELQNGSLNRIVHIWGDRTHGLIEILQNADDAQATEVSYIFLPNGILFQHNGKTFEKNDIDGICSVDLSPKDSEKNIGFMGVGFKSVFGITHAPCISSPPWSFTFSDNNASTDNWIWCVTPKWIDVLPKEIGNATANQTKMWLPYLQELNNEEKIEIGSRFFERFDGISLMFLRHIRKISLEKDGKRRLLSRDENQINEDVDGKKASKNYHVVKRTFPVPDDVKKDNVVRESRKDAKLREITLVFALSPDGNLIRIDEKPPLYCFLPTDNYPGFDFAINADFILDTARREVRDLKWNSWLWGKVSQTLKDAIEGYDGVRGFKHDEKYRYQFYKVLPTKKMSKESIDVIKNNFIDDFLKYCCENEVIITSNETWVKPNDAVIANPQILKIIDIMRLTSVCNRKNYVSEKVINVKELLVEIGVLDFNHAYFFDALTDTEWIKSKSHDWFEELYSYLHASYKEQHVLNYKFQQGTTQPYTDVLKILAIVKTIDGTVKTINEVMLPPENMDEQTRRLMAIVPNIYLVDVTFSKLVEWLKLHGTGECNSKSIIKKIVGAFNDDNWKKWDAAEIDRLVKYVSDYLKENDWNVSSDIEQITSILLKTESCGLQKAARCYIPSKGLELLYPNGYFVKIGSYEPDFLNALKIDDKPKILSFESEEQSGKAFLKFNEYIAWLGKKTGYVSSESIRNIYGIDGWEQISWTLDTSKMMFKYLIKNWPAYNQLSSFKRGYYRSRLEQIDSYLKWEITQTSWIPTTNGLMIPSSNIFIKTEKIHKIAGDAVPYLVLPEGISNADIENNGLIGLLGFSKDFDLDSLSHILEYVSNKPKPDLARLSRIYREIGKELEENADAKIEVSKLLTNDENTLGEPKTLLWVDDERIWERLNSNNGEGTKDILIVWAPEIEQRYLSLFFRKVGVRLLSNETKVDLILDKTKTMAFEPEVTSDFQKKAKYVFSLFAHAKNDNADEIFRKMCDIKLIKCSNVAIKMTIGNAEYLTSAETFYNVKENVLYYSNSLDSFDTAAELAGAFYLDFDYLSILEIIIDTEVDKLDKRLKRLKIQVVSPRDDADGEAEEEPIADLQPEDEKKEEEGDEKRKAREQPVDNNDKKNEAGARRKELSHDQLAKAKEDTEPDEAENPEDTGQDHYGGIKKDRLPKSSLQDAEKESRDRDEKEPEMVIYDDDEEDEPGTSIPYAERMIIEQKSIKRVIDYERKKGREAIDQRKKNYGWDVRSTDKENGVIRFIEVKGPSHVELTNHEKNVAVEIGANYFIYVVDNDLVYIVQDPAGKNPKKIIVSQTRWQLLNWKSESKMDKL